MSLSDAAISNLPSLPQCSKFLTAEQIIQLTRVNGANRE
jgi:hypothetical protein